LSLEYDNVFWLSICGLSSVTVAKRCIVGGRRFYCCIRRWWVL